MDPASRGPRRREPGAWARWIAPASLRARVFDPAMDDALRERRLRLRRARGLARVGIELLFALRTLAAALECRAMSRPRPLMMRQDVMFALRMLRKSPGFTLAAVLAIALGVGANTAIFTVVKQVLLQPLPFADPAGIVDVNERARGNASAVSPPNFMDWRAQNQTLSAIGAYSDSALTLSGGAEPMRVNGGLIDAEVLDVLGVLPMLGRAFTTDDTRVGGRRLVILGFDLWQRAFGGDRGIVARTVTLEGEPYEVVGVMPKGFSFTEGMDLWIPLRLGPRDLRDSQRGA